MDKQTCIYYASLLITSHQNNIQTHPTKAFRIIVVVDINTPRRQWKGVSQFKDCTVKGRENIVAAIWGFVIQHEGRELGIGTN